MSQNRALIPATPRSTRLPSLVAVAAASISATLAAITAFFAGSADARRQARNAAYLSEAADLNDLEVRVRELEKQSVPA